MQTTLTHYLQQKRDQINEALHRAAAVDAPVSTTLQQAIEYSLLAEGKRLRPILTLTTAEALGAPLAPVMPFACAIEMIHAYSLIHDDLPAMDDDDTRRGRPTNHKVFGEAMAILAGDALLTKAFGLMAQCTVHAVQLVGLIEEASRAAGAEGMVGGQARDILAEEQEISADELVDIHRHKTGALLRLSVRAGAILSGADTGQLKALTHFAENIGLAYQIQDDILDVSGDQQKTGKPVGSDASKRKSTFPELLGLHASRKCVRSLVDEAKAAISADPKIQGKWLCAIADYLVDREH